MLAQDTKQSGLLPGTQVVDTDSHAAPTWWKTAAGQSILATNLGQHDVIAVVYPKVSIDDGILFHQENPPR